VNGLSAKIIVWSVALLAAGGAPAAVLKVKLDPIPVKVDRLYERTPRAVRIVVKDARPPDPLIAWGVMGNDTLSGFYAESPEAVPKAIERAASDALAVFGLRRGDETVVEITLKVLRVDAFMPPFSTILPNVITYGVADVVVKPSSGEARPATTVTVVQWGSKPIPISFSRFAWEVAARGVAPALELVPDGESVRSLAVRLGREKDKEVLEQGAVWLGAAGAKEPAAAERLLALFRSGGDQSVAEAALVALARLGAPGLLEEVDGVLSGRTKVKGWEADDAEKVWHLLLAEHLLGEKSLGPKVPALRRQREKLTDLLAFLDGGRLPEVEPKHAKDLAEARDKAAKKMAK
jgi:hypothetical protein